MKETKKALIYARQSSGADDFSESVENQIENCKKLAEKENLEIVGIFSDLNTSGKTYPCGSENIAENDKAFQRWFNQQTGTKKFRDGLGHVMEKLSEVDFLIVDDMTRLYRPVTRSFLESYINDTFTENNVKILQVKGGQIDLSKFDQSLIQTLKNAINDEQIANQKQKSMQQIKKRKDSGLIASGGGKAFATVYDIGTKQILIDDEKAVVVEFIFAEIEKHTAYNKIIRMCNDRFKHLCNGKAFYMSNLYHIAENPIYCGYQYNSEGLLIKNKQFNKQLISFERWKAIQDLMNSKKKNPPRAKHNWLPFSGMLYCGNCGGKMITGIDNGKIYYHCFQGRNTGDKACKSARSNMTMQKDLYCGLKECITPLLVLSQFAEIDKVRELEKNIENIEAMTVELENKIKQQKQVTAMYFKGLIDEITLEDMLRDHKKQIADLTGKIEMARNADKELSEIKKHLQDTFKKFQAEKLMEGEISNSDFEIMLKKTILKITLFESKLEIETIYGCFTLDRYIYKNRRNFPLPELKVCGKGENLKAEIIYHTGKKKGLIADFGNLKVYSE